MKIALIVPSRERMNFRLNLICSIITTVDDINNVNLYIGVDDDDPTKHYVKKICKAMPFVKIVEVHNEGKFLGLGNLWNICAEKTTEDIIAMIGDDMIFRTPGWDTRIIEEFKNGYNDNMQMIHCDDGHINGKVSVNLFIHRRYTEITGYFMRKEFLIDWIDHWHHVVYSCLGRRKYLSDILIYHNHWHYGERPADNTTKRMVEGPAPALSNSMWIQLKDERRQEIERLGKILNITPDWSKFE